MTKKNVVRFSLAASYVIIMLIIGCIPDDSLQWSSDGSTGLLCTKGALYIVDGNSGALTLISDQNVQPWPAISGNGKLIAWSEAIPVSNFSKALEPLTDTQLASIKSAVKLLAERVQTDGLEQGKFPSCVAEGTVNKDFAGWVERYFVETADANLAAKIGAALMDGTKKRPLTLYRIIVAPADDTDNRNRIVASPTSLWYVKFSPNNGLLAYLADRIDVHHKFNAGFDLYIATIGAGVKAVSAAENIAVGYDWRADSRAVAYLKSDGDKPADEKVPLGTLCETTLISVDQNTPPRKVYVGTGDSLKTGDARVSTHIQPIDPNDIARGFSIDHTGGLAGVVFHSWMKVAYARDSRILFACAKMSFPSSEIDGETWSLFCYDPLTAVVPEIIPRNAADFAQKDVHLFTPSPDGTTVLLPGPKNTLALYPLGGDNDSLKTIVGQQESFGEDAPPKLAPAWKGNSSFTYLVAENSRFLTSDPNTPHRRKEIVVIDTDGHLKQVLSRNWPDMDLLK